MSREAPAEWTQTRLGDLVEISRASWNAEQIAATEAVSLYSIPAFDAALRPEEVEGSSIKSGKFEVPGDCVLFSKLNPRIPRVWRVRHSGSETALGSTEFWPLVPRRAECIDLDYLAHFLRSADFLNHPSILPASSTNSHQRVDRTAFEGFEFPLPPLAEQRRIAEILSSVDEAIQTTQAVIEQGQVVRRSVIDGLFSRGVGDSPLSETKLGDLPAHWDLVPAATVCETISVGIVIRPAQYYVSAGVKCFRSANVREGFVNDSEWVYISPESNKILRKSLLKTGDVLVVRSGYTGTSCVVTPDFDGTNCIDIIFARPDVSKINSVFLSSFINSAKGKDQVLQTEGGNAQKHFNVGALKQMLVPLPPPNEQNQIAAMIEAMMLEARGHEEGLAQLRRIKAALTSDLLTGRKRVTADLPLAAE